MRMDRKSFFKVVGGSALAAHLGGCGGTASDRETAGDAPVRRREPVITTGPKMAVITGVDPEAITRRAIEEMGGMGVFVSRGDKVLIKPIKVKPPAKVDPFPPAIMDNLASGKVTKYEVILNDGQKIHFRDRGHIRRFLKSQKNRDVLDKAWLVEFEKVKTPKTKN